MDNQVDNLAKAIIAAALIQANPTRLEPVDLVKGTVARNEDFFKCLPIAAEMIYNELKKSQT